MTPTFVVYLIKLIFICCFLFLWLCLLPFRGGWPPTISTDFLFQIYWLQTTVALASPLSIPTDMVAFSLLSHHFLTPRRDFIPFTLGLPFHTWPFFFPCKHAINIFTFSKKCYPFSLDEAICCFFSHLPAPSEETSLLLL